MSHGCCNCSCVDDVTMTMRVMKVNVTCDLNDDDIDDDA